jgi:hypothetical protein
MPLHAETRANAGGGRRTLLRGAAAILLGAWWIAACASTGAAGSDSSQAAAADADFPPAADFAPTTLYLVRRRWHIDVGFDTAGLRAPLAEVLRGLPGSRYALFGFGDRHYLLAKHPGAPELLGALWPGAGLILVTALSDSPQEAFGAAEVIELPLSAEHSRALQAFLWSSLARSAPGATMAPYAAGPYDASAYFAAVPRYSALHTCITWAAEAMRAGGFPIRSRLTLVAGQLWRQALKLRRATAARALERQDSSFRSSSIAGGRVAVIADHGGAAALRDDDGGLGGGWRRTAAADAAGQ